MTFALNFKDAKKIVSGLTFQSADTVFHKGF